MTAETSSAARAALDGRFEAVVFDWDGTAVPDRHADASQVRALVESLCMHGLDVAVVSGTHVGNVDGQLRARPAGPGRLLLALNRGSDVFDVGLEGARLVYQRTATAAEDAALTQAAEATVARLAARGLRAEIVSQRLNRRKIDLIPEPEWADPPKAEIDRLLTAVEDRLRGAGLDGLPAVVEVALAAATEAGLTEPRVTSDAKHVEIGLTDKSDSARFVFADLWRRGVAPGLVLVAGDEMGPLGGLPGSDSLMLVPEAAGAVVLSVGVEPEGVPPGVWHRPGGPDAFLAVLGEQEQRRREREVPDPGETPGWSLAVEGLDPEAERAREALLTIADGVVGTSGAPLLAHRAATPGVLAAGVYGGDGPTTDLLPAPLWDRVPGAMADGDRLRRVLDMRAGLLGEVISGAGGRGSLHSLRFSSLARPGTVALRAHDDGQPLPEMSPLTRPDDLPLAQGVDGRGAWMVVADPGSGGSVGAAAVEWRDETGRRLERLAAYEEGAAPGGPPRAAWSRVAEAEAAGYDRLLAEHRAAWAGRWDDADVVIDGDAGLQLATRVALFHLMASVRDRGEAGVGARGLSGHAYRGHVFWDADTFVLPFLAATNPPAARAMLEYRVLRLPAALDAARVSGYAGARFPWESAAAGTDVTPLTGRDRAGRVVPIRTGEAEIHVTAQVAWAAACYLDWTGDEEFAAGSGHRLLVETARFWASRVRLDTRGNGHLYGVIGPDEYHEPVDDNAFTNVMARWNLRRAAAAVAARPEAADVSEAERRRWLDLADAMIDGYDPATGRYEQFAGFFDLEPLVIAEVAPRRPITADLLLGRERVEGAQVVKQADVLMLHHLVPDEVVPGSLGPNLDFYEPRTAHGSSLSPGVHAAVFARAGRLADAVTALRLAARIDLDDLTDTTAGGLHLAAMGCVWQALAFGFAGLRPRDDRLAIDPRLPPGWGALELRVRFRGAKVLIRIAPDGTTVTSDAALTIDANGRAWECGPAGLTLPPAEVRAS